MNKILILIIGTVFALGVGYVFAGGLEEIREGQILTQAEVDGIDWYTIDLKIKNDEPYKTRIKDNDREHIYPFSYLTLNKTLDKKNVTIYIVYRDFDDVSFWEEEDFEDCVLNGRQANSCETKIVADMREERANDISDLRDWLNSYKTKRSKGRNFPNLKP